MRRVYVFVLGLYWLVTTATYMYTAHAAGQHRCCTAFSKVRAESLTHVRGQVQCWRQGITEGCNINAVVLKTRRFQMCVNPRPRKMRNLLHILCSNNSTGKTSQRPQRTTNG